MACVVAAVATGAGATASPRVIEGPSGSKIDFESSGTGTPIVLQAGLGDGLETWRTVRKRLEPLGRVVAYSRPGYGRSAATDAPRDPCSIARELDALLQAQGIAPPYVLVGHSIGGLYQWVYALLYPGKVQALVLLDPTHPEHWPTLEREAKGTARTIRAMKALFTPTMRAEFDGQQRCLESLDRTGARSIPAWLLVRTEYSMLEGQEFQGAVEKLQRDWLTLIGAERIEPVTGSSHYIQKDRPAAVVDAVRRALAAPRAPGSR